MKLNFLFILAFILNLLFTNTLIPNSQTYQFSDDIGQWSQIINPQPQLGANPSQYFLCGFAFRQMKWTKLLWNCNCGNKWQDFKFVYKCEWCNNTFWTMANGFRATFCHYNNWNDQIVKTFETGNQQSRKWPKHMCPVNTYASKGTVKFGRQHQTYTGFVGMMLQCSSIDLKQKSKIQDTYKHPIHELSTNTEGTFISTIQLKFIQKDKLTGINFFFEYIPVIAQISIKYNQIDGLRPIIKKIDNVFVVNTGKQLIQTALTFKNPYLINCTWNNLVEIYNKYEIGKDVKPKPLRIKLNNNSNLLDNSIYSETTSDFAFNKSITSTFTPITSIVTAVSPRTILQGTTTTIEESFVSRSYEMNVTFRDRKSGIKISDQLIIGIWTGVMASQLMTDYKSIVIDKITDPSVYTRYLSGGTYDSTEYKWTGWFGGFRGATTQTVEVPPDYWLVGVGARSGSCMDAMTFEYTSNQKDLIKYGYYGGAGGGAYQFRSDYLNGQWITKIGIWYEYYIIVGLQVHTNKGRTSKVMGRAAGPYSLLNVRWFKRFSLNHTPFIQCMQVEYM